MVKFLQILKANSYSWHKISFERVLYLYFFDILLYKDELIELDARVGCQILYKYANPFINYQNDILTIRLCHKSVLRNVAYYLVIDEGLKLLQNVEALAKIVSTDIMTLSDQRSEVGYWNLLNEMKILNEWMLKLSKIIGHLVLKLFLLRNISVSSELNI